MCLRKNQRFILQKSQLFWIGFSHVKGIGPVRLRRLLAFFGGLEEAWNASPIALEQAGLGPTLRGRLLTARESIDLNRLRDEILRRGIRILTWEDPDYPPSLREIDGSPPVLYLRGTLQSKDAWAVGVVGTRRMTTYGRQMTQEIVSGLARSGTPGGRDHHRCTARVGAGGPGAL